MATVFRRRRRYSWNNYDPLAKLCSLEQNYFLSRCSICVFEIFEWRGTFKRRLTRLSQVLLFPEEGWARSASSSYWTLTPFWWSRSRCKVVEVAGTRRWEVIIKLQLQHGCDFNSWKATPRYLRLSVLHFISQFRERRFYDHCSLHSVIIVWEFVVHIRSFVFGNYYVWHAFYHAFRISTVEDARRVIPVEITSSWEHIVYVKWIEVDNANGDRIPYNRGEEGGGRKGEIFSPLGGRITLGNWGPSNFPASIDFGAVKVAGRRSKPIRDSRFIAIRSIAHARAEEKAPSLSSYECGESHDKSPGGGDESSRLWTVR